MLYSNIILLVFIAWMLGSQICWFVYFLYFSRVTAVLEYINLYTTKGVVSNAWLSESGVWSLIYGYGIL